MFVFVKFFLGIKLGSYFIFFIILKSFIGFIFDKLIFVVLCKFGVGCSNVWCFYSYLSFVVDEKIGMVFSEEVCEKGKDCKDLECIKSYVSFFVVFGDFVGFSRLFCKY